jgi:hypothetical protein
MKKILVTVFFSVSFLVLSQNNESVNSDRPDQSEGTYILTKNKFQIENGVLSQDNVWINNLMLRYGLSKKTEIRIVSDFDYEKFNDDVNSIGISFKHKLLEQNKIIPEITLVGYFRNKIKNKFEIQNKENYSLVLAFQNIVSDQLIIGYNLGSNTLGETFNTTFFANYIFTKKITVFVEYFSAFEKNNSGSHNLDFGLFYLINNNFQLDFAYGNTINKDSNPFYSLGFSFKFDFKNNQ